MRPVEKILIFAGLAAALVVEGYFYPIFLAKHRTGGGNSATISACKMIMLDLQLASQDLGPHFDVSQLSQEWKTDITRAATNHWIVGARILLRTNITTGSGSNRIIVICDTAYGNVPQPTIWNGYRSNPAHAAGCSDGSSTLISPADFQKLNLAEFVDAFTAGNQPNRQGCKRCQPNDAPRHQRIDPPPAVGELP